MAINFLDPSTLGLGFLFAGALIISFIVFAVLYVYFALVWQTIAKKLKYKNHWLAWIPIAQWFLLPILADKHWGWGFFMLVPFANLVLFIIWRWEIYVKRKHPGWLSLIPILMIIPVVNVLAVIGDLVVMGIVAWNK